MTTSEKMEILREREDRAYETLRTLDPTTGVCKICLDVIGTISFLRSGLTLESVDTQLRVAHSLPGEGLCEEPKGIADRGVGDKPGHLGAATWEPGGGEAVEEEPAPADEPAPARAEAEAESPATNEEPQPTLTLNDMRDKLTPISIKYGNDLVAEAMNEMGYAKLSGIPTARYGELLSRVEEAVRCRQ